MIPKLDGQITAGKPRFLKFRFFVFLGFNLEMSDTKLRPTKIGNSGQISKYNILTPKNTSLALTNFGSDACTRAICVEGNVLWQLAICPPTTRVV